MKSVLITGTSRGIGKALTEEFHSHGWHVFATMRDPKKADFTRPQASPPSLEVLKLDVTSADSVAGAVETVRKSVKQLDVLINNAAVFPEEGHERLVEMKLEWFREAFETNVVSIARMIQQFRPLLAAGSRIANISSGVASVSSKSTFDYYAYSVSKSALNMLTRTVAAEFASDKIAVVAISPGWVRTDMGGSHAPLSTAESAQSLFHTITQLKIEQSGSFIDRNGQPMAL